MRCIAFVSPLGGTGQTTLLANLAHLWGASQHGVVLELSAQNVLGQHLGLPEPAASGWVGLAAADRWWGAAALENSQQVRFVPYGAEVASAALQQRWQDEPQWLQQQLAQLGGDDLGAVLLDAPAWPSPLAAQALRCADLVVVALEVAQRSLWAQPQLLAMLAQAPQARACMVATRFDPRRSAQQQALRGLRLQWQARLCNYVLHEDDNQSLALLANDCVTRCAPHAQSAHDLHGIAAWLTAQTLLPRDISP